MRLLFCLFAEDVGLLPERLFSKLVENTRFRAADFQKRVATLFAAMADGGSFGADDVAHFNGGLFADNTALTLTDADLEVLHDAAKLDWASVEPAIFGTLFERSLDPSKRGQIGAFYTGRDDILLIVEPVLMDPLRRRWDATQEQARDLIARRDDPAAAPRQRQNRQADLARLLTGFQAELASVRVLDPACGSGNFLYVALKRLLDLEKEVITFPASNMTMPQPLVGPEQLHGIEINPYAHELAQVVVWIGYIQWKRDNGFPGASDPILRPLDTIRHMDAILAIAEDGTTSEPPWPDADVIIGNPPFLGSQSMRRELGDDYVEALRALYFGRVTGGSELVTYWFERARDQVERGIAERVGLLSTQSIRSQKNRGVLERIKRTGDIFYAQADRPWVLDGASVRVSMIGFDNGAEQVRRLNESKNDPAPVALERAQLLQVINADLTAHIDIANSPRLVENLGICYQGPVKVGAFEIGGELANTMLQAGNPHNKPNSDVVRPWANASDVTGRSRHMSIVDFNDLPHAEAALYEAPFEYVRREVKPARDANRRTRRREYWWHHGETVPGLRRALEGLTRFLCTPRVARHRLFAWLPGGTLPDSRLYAFARDDDYFFGILHSRTHEVWSLATSPRHGVGNDPTYNNTTCFDTFALPWPPGQEPTDDPRVVAIGEAARELAEKRDAWLNPPGTSDADLKKRTLTNLYNQRPTWLQLAHEKLDHAVLDAYGWPHILADHEILENLLALNLSRPSA